MKTLKWMLTIASLVLVAGCDEKERFSRYPSVGIPRFEASEYVAQLSDKDPEVIYNAVCNLGLSAEDFGDALWGDKKGSEPASEEEWLVAQNVYTNICTLLGSKEPMVVAASLRFLQLFAKDHEQRSELIEPVCRIKSSHPLVQYEQVEILNRLTDDTTRLPEPLLRRLLNSKSWVVSRSTYELIGRLRDEPLRKELVARYRASKEENERLILLGALSEHAGPEEIELAQQEVFSAASTNISRRAVMLLAENLDAPGVFAWVVDHFQQLCSADAEESEIFDLVFDVNAEKRGEAARYLLDRGYVPGDDYLKQLNQRIENKPEAVPPELQQVVQELITVPEVAERWQAIRQKTDDKKQQCAVLEEALKPLREEYQVKVQSVLAEHGVPEEVQKKYMKQVGSVNVTGIMSELSP